jgi:hypothetical protein
MTACWPSADSIFNYRSDSGDEASARWLDLSIVVVESTFLAPLPLTEKGNGLTIIVFTEFECEIATGWSSRKDA